MEAPRYTAKEIEDGLYRGMDPDVELVAAQYYDTLRAELARVKAESLRVVADGEACPVHECCRGYRLGDFILNGQVYSGGVTTSTECTISNSREVARIARDVIVQPVRLEHWEDE